MESEKFAVHVLSKNQVCIWVKFATFLQYFLKYILHSTMLILMPDLWENELLKICFKAPTLKMVMVFHRAKLLWFSLMFAKINFAELLY